MEQEKLITVIVPVHMYDEEIEKWLNKALSSVERVFAKLVISTTQDIADKLDASICDRFVINDSSKTRFADMVNAAVDTVDTKFFSILELDDNYKLSKSVSEAQQCNIVFNEALLQYKYHPDFSVFIPMVDIVDANTNEFVSFANEAPWASDFSESLGVIDKESLENYYNYTLTGAVFVTEDFIKIGKLKETFELSFWYEYLLRAIAYNKQNVMVLPKNGYIHRIKRTGSLFDIYEHTMEKDEVNFWFKSAQEEAKTNVDNRIAYVKDANNG